MKSSFNSFTWAYMLNQDRINYGHNPDERLKMYAEYHEWTEEFTQEVREELAKLEI